MTWHPSLGCWLDGDRTWFRVWASSAGRAEAVVQPPTGPPFALALERSPDGVFSGSTDRAPAGSLYRYRLDGSRQLPDPASRFQPHGVHGSSEVVDAARFVWTDGAWTGVSMESAVFYELHVGTFTPEGTFASAATRLPELVTLGVSIVELMPVADFAGDRNWGYDGVAPFAPARCYGEPDDLRRFIDTAHRLGVGVALDVVYNHLGPDGAVLGAYSPEYFTERHHTPWGAAINFDAPGSEHVRAFVVENALYWIHEYHVDALRLDATHAIIDDSARHIVAEVAERVHQTAGSRRALVIAEDHRNLAAMLRSPAEQGWGLDGIWADDFHHACRRFLAGDADGYYRDFSGRLDQVATAVRRGWIFTGQYSQHLAGPRGTDPTGLDPSKFVVALQNHDQIGNRAFGERLHHQVDLAAWRAASAILVLVPETPLLFMGQEWAASAPFQYFTDHEPGLGRLVTEGRRREFEHFRQFSDPATRARIPDPQAYSTFAASRLDWNERAREPHASVLRLYSALASLRRRIRTSGQQSFDAYAIDDAVLVIVWGEWLIVARLKGAGEADLFPFTSGTSLERILTTEDPGFCPDPHPVAPSANGPLRLTFSRPAAAVFKRG